MKLFISIGISCILLAVAAHAQEHGIDTVMQLDTISIRAERYLEFSSGQKISRLSEEMLVEDRGNHIGNILSENSSVYIRSYGQSSVTSMSIRGTSSAQSGIFWNGVNIRMPSLGSTDLSLIPASFFNSASIVYGGNSIRYGSGTIGGAVFLSNLPDFSGYHASGLYFRAGSFGSLGTTASASISRKKFYLNIVIDAQQARNNFRYTNTRNETIEMENAGHSGLGITAHAARKIGNKHQADLYLWYQEAIREIPPSMSMNSSKAYLSDRAFRSSLQWKSYFNKGVLTFKSAWFSEYENYTDPRISLQSTINTNTGYLEAEYRHQLSQHSYVDAGVSITAEQAELDAYEGAQDRTGLAGFLNYKVHFPQINWNMVAGARQEISRSSLSPFTPSVGFEGPLFSFLSQKISLSRNYRLPTMNELYWQPGGNPDIHAENSWNAEMSFVSAVFPATNKKVLDFTVTAFSSLVNDWIMWVPQNSLWYAENVRKVWARGIELESVFKTGDQIQYAEVHLTYTYSRSTIKDQDAPTDITGNQLIYTPLHNGGGKLKLGFRNWLLSLFGKYTGKSYVTSDNMQTLAGFYITDLAIKRDIYTKSILLGISARMNNIFDTEYQVVAYRPMPGRNFQISLSLTFKN